MYFTKMVFMGASVLMGCWAVIQATPASLRARDAASAAAQGASLDQDAPQKRFFFAISPEPCKGTTGRSGVCRDPNECKKMGGSAEGACAFLGIGTCCVPGGTLYTCGSEVTSQEAVFANPNDPNPEPGTVDECVMQVTVMSDVCQLRVDLTEFSLAQPDNEGTCITDIFTVSGGSTVPELCGENDGQHLYVDVTSGSSVDLAFNTEAPNGRWNIKVTQIPCNSADEAPTGCLQYFIDTSGIISSFNFDSTGSSTETRQLSGQSYSVCIGGTTSCDSVTYTQPSDTAFSVTGDPSGQNPNIPALGNVGSSCTTDYIIIPSGTIVDPANVDPAGLTSADRFCGMSFPGATTSLKPFVLTVVNDDDEATGGDSGNQGFQLMYTLNGC